MIPILLGLGAFIALHHHMNKKRGLAAASPSGGKTAPPKVVAKHAAIMRGEYHPDKLESAARAFGAEGFNQLASQLVNKAGQVRQQASVIPDLVERARAGDQNAMALIAAAKENAERGLARAAITCALVEQYCKRHPPAPRVGDETLASGSCSTEAA